MDRLTIAFEFAKIIVAAECAKGSIADPVTPTWLAGRAFDLADALLDKGKPASSPALLPMRVTPTPLHAWVKAGAKFIARTGTSPYEVIAVDAVKQMAVVAYDGMSAERNLWLAGDFIANRAWPIDADGNPMIPEDP